MNIGQENRPNMKDFFEFRPRKGDLKKMEIILAAIECISTIGLEKTTYEAIATIIGTRKAHVAYHFKNKNDIFEASIRYINASYQKTSSAHIESILKNDPSGEEVLLSYIEGPFIWAKQNPQELCVMLLFYYLCTIDPKYRSLHEEIRHSGALRIQTILSTQLSIEPKDSKTLSKAIQNLITGAIIDTATTEKKDLDFTVQEIKKTVTRFFLAPYKKGNLQ